MKFFVLLITLFSFYGCDLSWFTKDPVVVTVGDVRLKESDLRAKVTGWDSLSSREQIAWIEAWIDEELLYQEALNLGIHKEKKIKERLLLTERKIVVEAFVSKVTDSLSIDFKEAKRFYDIHPELFMYDKWSWSGFIVSFTDWKLGNSYHKSYKEKVFKSLPNQDYRIKKITPFDSVSKTPDACLAEDLRTLSVGHLLTPKICEGFLKTLVITDRQDSGTVIPFELVNDQAHALAQINKQKEVLNTLKTDLKKKRPIFSNPKLFTESSDQKRNQ